MTNLYLHAPEAKKIDEYVVEAFTIAVLALSAVLGLITVASTV